LPPTNVKGKNKKARYDTEKVQGGHRVKGKNSDGKQGKARCRTKVSRNGKPAVYERGRGNCLEIYLIK